jgi:AraC-like DNA-binding protein
VQSDQVFSYSARLLKPFITLLTQPAGCAARAETPQTNGTRDPDERIPIHNVHEWLAAAIERTQDPNLGVRAGALMATGDAGVVDYVLDTASTVAEALEVTARYMRLLNDAVDCRLELDGSRVLFRMDARIATPPAAEDFMLTGFFTSHAWLRAIPDLEFWFMHPAPQNPIEHRRTFGATSCRFGAPCSGATFSRIHLQKRLERADPNLHALTRRLADIMLAELPPESSLFSDRVRTLVARELATPRLSTSWVARRLRMSSRTLARRLEAENTTFFALLDDARRDRAMRLMEDRSLTLTEIAFVLGFAHVASFHRAFRRWTGRTPADYRQGLSGRSAVAVMD